MTEDKKKTYPMLPVQHWWNLRDKFKQSIPGVVTDSYLATALDMQPESARVNIKPYLRDIGIIDDEGKTTPLAREWRDDQHYIEVCKKIIDAVYPDELKSAVPNPSEDRAAVERWFSLNTGNGLRANQRMAAFYITLAEADASKRPEKNHKKETKPRKEKDVKPAVKIEPQKEVKKDTPPKVEKKDANTSSLLPSININLEIHISSDATPDQIEKIFESMAKHIYK